jgi:hypothetical protein
VRDASVGELLLRVATGRRTEARIAINSYVFSAGSGVAHGMEDLNLGMKLRLADSTERFCLTRPAVSLIVETSLPTGSSAFRSNEMQPGAKILLSWDLSEAWSLSSNLNYTYASDAGKRFDQWSASLSLGRSLTDRMSAYLEAFSFLPGGPGGPNAHYLNGGLTYLINPDFQLDFRVGAGLNSPRPDDFIGVGAARRW